MHTALFNAAGNTSWQCSNDLYRGRWAPPHHPCQNIKNIPVYSTYIVRPVKPDVSIGVVGLDIKNKQVKVYFYIYSDIDYSHLLDWNTQRRHSSDNRKSKDISEDTSDKRRKGSLKCTSAERNSQSELSLSLPNT